MCSQRIDNLPKDGVRRGAEPLAGSLRVPLRTYFFLPGGAGEHEEGLEEFFHS